MGARETQHTTAVVFDLSEVLIAGLIGVEHRLAPILQLSARDVLIAFGGEPLRELCRGRLSEDDYVAELLSRTAWRLTPEVVKKHVHANFHWKIGGMRELVQELAGRYELCLYSDHAREWIDYIRAVHPFLAVFQKQVYSYEIGRTKDEPGAFEEALLRLGRQAGECVFVDDSDINVRQATACGIRSVRFFGCGALRSSLATQGVRPA